MIKSVLFILSFPLLVVGVGSLNYLLEPINDKIPLYIALIPLTCILVVGCFWLVALANLLHTLRTRFKAPAFSSRERLLVLVILASCILFFWFQVRPTSIHSSCDSYTRDKVKTSPTLTAARYKLIYEACLHSKGL